MKFGQGVYWGDDGLRAQIMGVVGITFKGKYTFMAKEELFEINPIF